MALGGKTVQYTLAVDLQTGQLSAESKKVANDLGLIQKSTKGADGSMLDFARSVKQMKSELSLLLLGSFGGYALAVGAVGDALSFAAGKAKEFMFGVKFDPAVLSDLNQYVTGLQLAGKAQSELMALKVDSLAMDIKINKAQNETAKAGGSLVSSIFGGGPGVDPLQIIANFQTYLGAKQKENKLIDEKNAKIKDQETLLKEMRALTLAQAEKEYNEEVKKGIPINKEFNQLLFERKTLFADERLQDSESALSDSNLQMAQITMQLHSDMLVSQKELLVDSLESLDAISDDNTMKFHMRDIEADRAWYNEKQSLLNMFVSGMVDGFSSIGESLVNGQNGFKSFGAAFIKTLGMLAVQFGSFLIAVGVGMSAVPELFGLKGAGAIAAGTALVVLGGALGALAGKISGGSSGVGRASEQEQRFRDSKFGTSGSNGTTIINNINFANTIGLTRDSMKEVGEIISKELFKQEKLGRIETVG